ncbi:MAG TPA: hypothetical protein VM120_25530 [Bryobacteraceae bacterium]|nr:hypothetical protein [Bryobacteraceae bacterium]
MQEVLAGASGAFALLCVFGPLIYLGLFLVIDPVKAVAPLNKAINCLCRLEAALFYYMDLYRDQDLVRDSSQMRAGLRMCGALITIFGVSHLIGLA